MFKMNKIRVEKGTHVKIKRFAGNLITSKGKGNKVIAKNAKDCTININGINNTLTISDDCKIHNTSFNIKGDNCKITIGSDGRILNSHFNCISNNSLIDIGRKALIETSHVSLNNSGNIIIGDISFLNAVCIKNEVSLVKPVDVIIGKNCMLGERCKLIVSDYHPIYYNGKISNPEKSIVLKDHVWLSEDVKVQKGATIPKDCVIASRSTVTKTLTKEGSLYGGTPAKWINDKVADWRK